MQKNAHSIRKQSLSNNADTIPFVVAKTAILIAISVKAHKQLVSFFCESPISYLSMKLEIILQPIAFQLWFSSSMSLMTSRII